MTTEEMIEKMARALWVSECDPRHWDGTTGARWAAYVEEQKPLYLERARKVLAEFLPVLRDGCGVDREVAGEWDDFNAGWNCAVNFNRARFDAIAKEIEG